MGKVLREDTIVILVPLLLFRGTLLAYLLT